MTAAEDQRIIEALRVQLEESYKENDKLREERGEVMPDVKNDPPDFEFKEDEPLPADLEEDLRGKLDELKGKVDSLRLEQVRSTGIRNIALDAALRLTPTPTTAIGLIQEANLIEHYLTTGEVPTIQLKPSRVSNSNAKQPLPPHQGVEERVGPWPSHAFDAAVPPAATMFTASPTHGKFCSPHPEKGHGPWCFSPRGDTIPGRAGGIEE